MWGRRAAGRRGFRGLLGGLSERGSTGREAGQLWQAGLRRRNGAVVGNEGIVQGFRGWSRAAKQGRKLAARLGEWDWFRGAGRGAREAG